MKINVFNIQFKTNPNQPIVDKLDPVTIEIDEDTDDIDTAIVNWFKEKYDTVPAFEWDYHPSELIDSDTNLDDEYSSVEEFAERIRDILRRYFETNDDGEPSPEFDEDFTSQAVIDEIHELVGNI